MELLSHGVVVLIRNAEGKFLLLEDARDAMLGCWAPPHGRCDATDASEEAAVRREVLEETGLVVVPVKKLLTQAADTKVKTVSFWLATGSEAPIELNDESSACGWFDIHEALSLKLYPGTRIFFEKVVSQDIILS